MAASWTTKTCFSRYLLTISIGIRIVLNKKLSCRQETPDIAHKFEMSAIDLMLQLYTLCTSYQIVSLFTVLPLNDLE